MTCIVGLAENNTVYMGADSGSGSSGDWDMRISAVPKLFRSGPFLIGYTSSWRMGQILQHHLHMEELVLPVSGSDVQEFMVCTFIEKVREALKTFAYATKEHNEETGGQFLVGCFGHLFHIESDYQVNEAADGMDACGCAEKFALGALWSSRAEKPRERIAKALDAAAYFSGGVRPPMIIESVDDER
ncbi:MAG TPA: hypothetical protein VMW79_10915 [Anaerolineae bacterium]|nr:hypothetical protein [Anaerolineae bacterium]